MRSGAGEPSPDWPGSPSGTRGTAGPGNAVLSSSSAVADRLFVRLLESDGFASRPEAGAWLEPLARTVGARNNASEIRRLAGTAATHASLADRVRMQRVVVTGLAEGLAISNRSLSQLRGLPRPANRMIRDLMNGASEMAADVSLPEQERLEAIRLLAHGGFSQVRDSLAKLVASSQTQAVQLAGIEALERHDAPEIANLLLQDWTAQTPDVRSRVLTSLLSRRPWTHALLQAIQEERVASSQIKASRRELLMNHDEAAIRDQAKSLFASQTPGTRQQALADYQVALTLEGDRGHGEAVYRRECIQCHRLSSTEHLVGPNLITGSYKDPEPLLTNILDPNRFVEPQYLQYVVTDRQRRLFTGIITDQNSESITLVEGEDVQNTVLRKEILEMRATGKSLMPEGVEETVTPQEMADLLRFILDYQYVIGTESAGYGPGDEIYEPLATRRWRPPGEERREMRNE